MTKRTITAGERRGLREDRATQYFHAVFRAQLGALQTLEQARALAAAPLEADDPCQRFHDRLASFLDGFEVPAASALAERLLYVAFVRRLAAAGALEPGLLEVIEERFRRSGAPSTR